MNQEKLQVFILDRQNKSFTRLIEYTQAFTNKLATGT